MLASLRRFAATWPAKVFFIVLVGSFGLWGVADVGRNLLSGAPDPNSAANVGSQRVSAAELQDVVRRNLIQRAQAKRSAAPPTPEERQQAAAQGLDLLVTQAAFADAAARLRVSVSDDAVRLATFENPTFLGPNHQFDRPTFQSWLRTNQLTEARYVTLIRNDIAQRELAEAVRGGGYAPDVAAKLFLTYQSETRTADLVILPFAGAAEPAAPTAEQLERFYDDNAGDYRAPEYRRVRIVILSPETVAKTIEVSDADARTWFDAHKAEFNAPETRTVQIVVAPTEAAGRTLATAWTIGADWPAMQRQAAAAGASALQLDDQTQAAFPSPDLAAPVFAAPADAVTGPVQGEGGWTVFRVTKLQGGTDPSFEAVAADVRARLALDQASDEVYARANTVQDSLAGGTKLDDLAPELGLAAVTGTLDRQGNTPEGGPAPIPASPAVLAAIVDKAFAMAPGDAPTLESGPDRTSFAVAVEAVTPAGLPPLDRVEDRVRQDWLRAARRHEQDLIATRLMTAVNDGGQLKDAAAAAGVAVTRSPPVSRGRQTAVPDELVRPLFAADIGHALIAETPTGFVVAVPVAAGRSELGNDPAVLDRLRLAQAAQVSDDLEETLAAALRAQARVVVNRPVFDSIAR